ncbi:MAG: HigA family addiction module antitoxin [Pelistega sp.]|nr:HigA family addiction module antitoxin [Pelistega sp.]
MMRMHNPPYPALTIKEDILPEFGLSVTEAAKQLGVNRVTLSNLLNGNSAISAEMALRLHAWLGKDSPSPESWLHQQASYDLWQVEQRVDFKVTPVKEAMKAQKKTKVDNP